MESTMATTIELRCYTTFMGEDGIVRSIVKQGSEITLDDAIANSKAVNSFYNGQKYPLLVDSRLVKSMTKDARNYLSINNRSTNINSFAVIVGSSLSSIIVNFFFRLQKPSVPAKLFTNEKEALSWLEKHKSTTTYV